MTIDDLLHHPVEVTPAASALSSGTPITCPIRPSGTDSAEDRQDDLRHRLDVAAVILAETLIDMWRREQRVRQAAPGERDES